MCDKYQRMSQAVPTSCVVLLPDLVSFCAPPCLARPVPLVYSRYLSCHAHRFAVDRTYVPYSLPPRCSGGSCTHFVPRSRTRIGDASTVASTTKEPNIAWQLQRATLCVMAPPCLEGSYALPLHARSMIRSPPYNLPLLAPLLAPPLRCSPCPPDTSTPCEA